MRAAAPLTTAGRVEKRRFTRGYSTTEHFLGREDEKVNPVKNVNTASTEIKRKKIEMKEKTTGGTYKSEREKKQKP
uniref:Uncharacterized protein n=1 Tax=Romanomermis culicivorax TaxID=13658 RepID=A0A915K1J2_ROMCU